MNLWYILGDGRHLEVFPKPKKPVSINWSRSSVIINDDERMNAEFTFIIHHKEVQKDNRIPSLGDFNVTTFDCCLN